MVSFRTADFLFIVVLQYIYVFSFDLDELQLLFQLLKTLVCFFIIVEETKKEEETSRSSSNLIIVVIRKDLVVVYLYY